MTKLKQLTIKLSDRQWKGLKSLAEDKGDQPISYVIREAIAECLKKHGKI